MWSTRLYGANHTLRPPFYGYWMQITVKNLKMLIIIHVSTISTISTNLAETGGNGLKP